jgi:RND family efflux transporter MFP subunit
MPLHRPTSGALGASVLAIALGCGGEAPPAEAPAHIENPVAETDLTTVHLTEDAVRRIGVEVSPVERRALPRTRSVGGELVAPSGSSVTISAPRAAIVLPPESGPIPSAGAIVGAGQPILRLAVLAPDELAGPQQALSVAEARLENARAREERTRMLYADSVASLTQLEDATAELRAAEAAWQAARARAELLSSGYTTADVSALRPVVVSAPRAGRIQAMRVAAGQTVGDGAALVEVVDTDPLWVRVPVFPSDAARIDRELEAAVGRTEDAAEDVFARPIQGPTTADPAAASIDLYYSLANTEGRFRPGERVTIRLPLSGSAQEQIVVPHAAVVRDLFGGSWVYEETSAAVYARRRVEVIDVVDGFAVISRGIEQGVPVVVVGAAELYSTEFGGAAH